MWWHVPTRTAEMIPNRATWGRSSSDDSSSRDHETLTRADTCSNDRRCPRLDWQVCRSQRRLALTFRRRTTVRNPRADRTVWLWRLDRQTEGQEGKCQHVKAATTKPNAYRHQSFCTHFPFLQLENFLHPSICLLSQFWISSHLETFQRRCRRNPHQLKPSQEASFTLKLPTNPRTVPNTEGSVHQSVDFRLGGVTSDPSLCKHKVSVSVFPSFGSLLLIMYQITNPADSCMATAFSALHLVLVDSGWVSLPRLSHRSTCRGRVSGVLRYLTSLSNPGYQQPGSVWGSAIKKSRKTRCKINITEIMSVFKISVLFTLWTFHLYIYLFIHAHLCHFHFLQTWHLNNKVIK